MTDAAVDESRNDASTADEVASPPDVPGPVDVSPILDVGVPADVIDVDDSDSADLYAGDDTVSPLDVAVEDVAGIADAEAAEPGNDDTVSLLDVAVEDVAGIADGESPDLGNDDDTPDIPDGLDSSVPPDVPPTPGDTTDAGPAVGVPGDPCDDGNTCTGPDTLGVDLVCIGPALPCDDGKPCTQDHCYQLVGCTHVADASCAGPCPECPYSLGFECDTTVAPPVCQRPSTNEVYVPSGLFWFGFNENVVPLAPKLPDWVAQDTGTYLVYLPGFAMDRTEILSDDFAAWSGYYYCPLYPTECTGPGVLLRRWSVFSIGNYCQSLGKRLCSESEWEKAAIGGCAQLGLAEDQRAECRQARRLYPWGNEPMPCPPAKEWPCPLPETTSGGAVDNWSIYGVRNLMGELLGEGALGIDLETSPDATAESVSLPFGLDGVTPPPPAGYLPSGEWHNWWPLAFERGYPGWPSFKRFTMHFEPNGQDARSRCCATIYPSALVSPGDALPWPAKWSQ